ncbi:hypothetical protein MMC12_006666 [Toensbergia leucococca]|nr:hypothetical protein [Toensbergia leucococca]
MKTSFLCTLIVTLLTSVLSTQIITPSQVNTTATDLQLTPKLIAQLEKQYNWTTIFDSSTAINYTLDKALGINCRGSSHCSRSISTFGGQLIDVFIQLLRGSPAMNIYGAGAHIACLPAVKVWSGGFCVFTQGPHVPYGVSADFVLLKLQELHDHGCGICGSVPLTEDNDPEIAGIMTVNFVSGGGICPGLCPPTYVPPSFPPL